MIETPNSKKIGNRVERKIEVDLAEIRRVFDLLEKINGLFHQPLKYKDTDLVEAFAKKNYPEIKNLYYHVIWDLLPDDVKEDIENS